MVVYWMYLGRKRCTTHVNMNMVKPVIDDDDDDEEGHPTVSHNLPSQQSQTVVIFCCNFLITHRSRVVNL
jgi:hypothetical protein